MKKIMIFFLLLSGAACAQKLPGDGFDKVRIAGSDQTVQAELKESTGEPAMKTDRLYFWYSGNRIQATQGGYSGRLLNGKYSVYYPNKNLKELGAFKGGLKDGIWRSWNESGVLLQSYIWRNGIKAGAFSLFDEHGLVRQSGSYRNDLLEGPLKNYGENNRVSLTYYREGTLISHPFVSFWDKINIFSKKNKKIKSSGYPTK
jgi:antitoxin component YwqK of YwqJK toxin-antitoxin module